eukprot:TRINITY_DN3039_c0_g1_i2.p1 TRINITY_DN3039_c0_g1~~TRINITY_DN3039_c0_g1_i2.p1  ORF type:complete len:139 (+),score=26.56 TRINITY_DN3039_c0_g1_i2:35-418(+)
MNTTDIADVQLTKEDEQLAQQITDQIIQQAQQPPEEKLDVETVIKILADHLVAREDIPEERRTTEFHNRVNDLFDLLVLADQAQADLIKLVTGNLNLHTKVGIDFKNQVKKMSNLLSRHLTCPKILA